jgi:hypothetical protein
MTEEQDRLLNLIIESIMAEGVEDLRQMFWLMSKEELINRYSQVGFELFRDFKVLINEQFGSEEEEKLTLELISKIYDEVKWLN